MERVQLFVDPNDSRGLVSQLYAQLRDAIADGRLAPGDRLTATRTLATELGVSRFTVTEVYARLTAEGLVEGRAGGGSIVRATSALDCSPIRPAALAPRGRASRIQRFDRDPLVQATFDMRPGAVDMSLFPVQMWRRCMVRALRQPATHYSDPAGTWELRTALARWINRSRGIVTAPEDVIV